MAQDVFYVLRPPIHKPKRTIVVLGAPRGGTSMVSATLRKLGVMMGDRLGHQHEDPAFRREVPLEEKLATVQKRNAEHDVWGWKLPGAVYYIRDLLPHLQNPHFVAVFRNPLSVSRSSADRSGDEVNDNAIKLLQVALNATQKVVDVLKEIDAPAALVSFESVIQQPEAFARQLAAFVGVSDETLIAEAAGTAINKQLGYKKF
ncbi:MAG TPA: hypothetical protein VHE81_00410 [Lacipirellulaceae bacterium]|nr:hypothetical protein [Lacipirellulaceae bacterium]